MIKHFKQYVRVQFRCLECKGFTDEISLYQIKGTNRFTCHNVPEVVGKEMQNTDFRCSGCKTKFKILAHSKETPTSLYLSPL